ncbi:MAG: DUF4250 domain-containing protein [Lachnospiraceae bacterium]
MNPNKTIPTDPVILLSYLNTQLRDFYPTLEELCGSLNIDREEIEKKMQGIDYYYDRSLNKFI